MGHFAKEGGSRVSQGSSEPALAKILQQQKVPYGLGSPQTGKLAGGTGCRLVGGCRAVEREMGRGGREAGKEDGFTF